MGQGNGKYVANRKGVLRWRDGSVGSSEVHEPWLGVVYLKKKRFSLVNVTNMIFRSLFGSS